MKYCSQSRDQDSNISPINSCQLPKLISFDSFFEPQIQAFNEPREFTVRPYFGNSSGFSNREYVLRNNFNSDDCKCDQVKCAKGICECQKQGLNCTTCKEKDNGEEKIIKKVKPCKCKKSGCQKGYCDCYNNGDFCSDLCRCLQCKNKKNRPIKITTLGVITSDLIQNSLITRRQG
ncbi:hypothetical protein pb186bvf_013428 [Paramecium bursaria]